MNLRERATREYEKEKKLTDERNVEEAETFADKAVVELQNVLGVRRVDIMTVDKQPGYADFSVDDMLFRVSSSEYYYVITIIRKCSTCGSDFSTRILDLRDIGRSFIEPHFKYDCDQALKTKERLEKMKRENADGDVLSTEERLLAALKDFVAENDHMRSHI